MIESKREHYLINRIINYKDEYAFKELIDSYIALIRYIIMKRIHNVNDIDDIIQTVLIKVWNKIYLYNKAKGLFINWLYTVTTNEINNFISRIIQDDYIVDIMDTNTNTLTDIYLSDLKRFMSDDEYDILILKIVFHQSYTNIYKLYNNKYSFNTIRNIYSSAIKKAYKYFGIKLQFKEYNNISHN